MDWKLVLEIALFLAAGAACALALPFLRERLGAERLKSLWKWTCLCVQAAEQLFGPGAGERTAGAGAARAPGRRADRRCAHRGSRARADLAQNTPEPFGFGGVAFRQSRQARNR